MRSQRLPHRRPAMGFTLAEMLVAIAILAIMAGLSWRGLDAMVQSKNQNQAYQQQVLSLQASLAQWNADLDAMLSPSSSTVLDLQGSTLRFVRQAPTVNGADPALVVVAYGQLATTVPGQPPVQQWVRWQSERFQDQAGLAAAWKSAATWASGLADEQAPGSVTLATIASWKLWFYANSEWQVNPPPANSAQAIRLELELATGQPLAGWIKRQWLAPQAGGTR